MSQQIDFLKNVISSVQAGSLGATDLLRQICLSAIEKAPVHGLITLGECLCKLDEEAIPKERD
jgi:hypothetical protein